MQPAEKYINRELSFLEFNRRVLEQARDESIPILERLRFLCISCTNLDEFFEVRVAAMKQRLEIGARSAGPDNISPQDLLDEIRHRTLVLVRQQYEMLNKDILPALAEEQIHFVHRSDWTATQRNWLSHYYRDEIVPVLRSVATVSTHPQ
jgi:polyphosphate kinase